MFSPVNLDSAALRSQGMRLLLVFLALASLKAQETGGVTIRVVDESGLAIDCAVDSFVSLDHKRDLSSHFEGGLHGSLIPYGTYIYTLSRKPPIVSAGVITHRIEIKRPETLSVVVADRFPLDLNSKIAADSKAQGFLIRGKIDPLPAPGEGSAGTLRGQPDEPLWIRLGPLADGEGLAADVDSLGNFRIFENLRGRYILSVVRGSRLLATREIVFQQTGASPTSFTVDIRGDHFVPIFVK